LRWPGFGRNSVFRRPSSFAAPLLRPHAGSRPESICSLETRFSANFCPRRNSFEKAITLYNSKPTRCRGELVGAWTREGSRPPGMPRPARSPARLPARLPACPFHTHQPCPCCLSVLPTPPTAHPNSHEKHQASPLAALGPRRIPPPPPPPFTPMTQRHCSLSFECKLNHSHVLPRRLRLSNTLRSYSTFDRLTTTTDARPKPTAVVGMFNGCINRGQFKMGALGSTGAQLVQLSLNRSTMAQPGLNWCGWQCSDYHRF
jgi:hypothetical protein